MARPTNGGLINSERRKHQSTSAELAARATDVKGGNTADADEACSVGDRLERHGARAERDHRRRVMMNDSVDAVYLRVNETYRTGEAFPRLSTTAPSRSITTRSGRHEFRRERRRDEKPVGVLVVAHAHMPEAHGGKDVVRGDQIAINSGAASVVWATARGPMRRAPRGSPPRHNARCAEEVVYSFASPVRLEFSILSLTREFTRVQIVVAEFLTELGGSDRLAVNRSCTFWSAAGSCRCGRRRGVVVGCIRRNVKNDTGAVHSTVHEASVGLVNDVPLRCAERRRAGVIKSMDPIDVRGWSPQRSGPPTGTRGSS